MIPILLTRRLRLRSNAHAQRENCQTAFGADKRSHNCKQTSEYLAITIYKVQTYYSVRDARYFTVPSLFRKNN